MTVARTRVEESRRSAPPGSADRAGGALWIVTATASAPVHRGMN
jgi:hypothetical protein